MLKIEMILILSRSFCSLQKRIWKKCERKFWWFFWM